jgi:ABC-type multidrug transport system fused ATPase/permease subunit
MDTPVVVEELRVRKSALFLAAFLWTLVIIGLLTIAFMVYRIFVDEVKKSIGWQEILIMVVLAVAIFAFCLATLYVVVTRKGERKKALESEAVRIRDSRRNRVLKKQIRELDEIARQNRQDETARSRVRSRNRMLEIENAGLQDQNQEQIDRNQELLRNKRDLKAKIRRMRERQEEERIEREQEQQQPQGYGEADPAMQQQQMMMQQQQMQQQQQY